MNGLLHEVGHKSELLMESTLSVPIQVFLITIQFSAPRPKAAALETSQDGGMTFQPVQYFADDCMSYFGLVDDGPILAADDVNCITSISR